MAHRKFAEEPIIAVLKEAGAGASTADLFRKYGMSDARKGRVELTAGETRSAAIELRNAGQLDMIALIVLGHRLLSGLVSSPSTRI